LAEEELAACARAEQQPQALACLLAQRAVLRDREVEQPEQHGRAELLLELFLREDLHGLREDRQGVFAAELRKTRVLQQLQDRLLDLPVEAVENFEAHARDEQVHQK